MRTENSSSSRAAAADHYDLLILGGGPAGSFAAEAAAGRELRLAVVLPEQTSSDPAPSAAMTEQFHRIQIRAGTFVPPLAGGLPGVDVYRGQPTFSAQDAVVVGSHQLRFRTAIIATGTNWGPPEIEGADAHNCLRPEDLTRLADPPARVAVVGTGPEACLWAEALVQLESEVYLVGPDSSVLPGEDSDAARMIQQRMEQEGVRMHLGCRQLAVEQTGHLRAVVLEYGAKKEKLLVDEILVCDRRRPNVEDLALETVSVAADHRGVFVDEFQRTTNRRVLAAGAVCGAAPAGLAAAKATARLAVDNALGWRQRTRRHLVIPRCVYTHPQIVQLGLTARQARQRGIEIDTRRAELDGLDTSVAASRRQGFVAIHVDRRRRRLVGATAVAEDADELIAPIQLLMTCRRPPTVLAAMVTCYPSRLELLQRLAADCLETQPGGLTARVLRRFRW